MEDIYSECIIRSREKGKIYLPNNRCSICGFPRIENGVLIIEYNQAPGIVRNDPFETDRPLTIHDATSIEFRLKGRRTEPIRLVPEES